MLAGAVSLSLLQSQEDVKEKRILPIQFSNKDVFFYGTTNTEIDDFLSRNPMITQVGVRLDSQWVGGLQLAYILNLYSNITSFEVQCDYMPEWTAKLRHIKHLTVDGLGGSTSDCFFNAQYFPIQLESFSTSSNNLTNLEECKAKYLRSIRLTTHGDLLGMKALKKIPRLREVFIPEANLSGENMKVLGDLNLDSLEILCSNPGPYTFITNLRELRHIKINHDTHFNLALLSELHQLEKIEIYLATRLTDLSPLKNLQKLCTLKLDMASALEDLTPLQELPKLEKIIITFSKIQDLTPLQNLPLTQLNLMGGKVESVAPLSKIPSLQILQLGSTKPLDWSMLGRHTGLRRISMDSWDVKQTHHFATMPALQLLCGNGVHDLKKSQEGFLFKQNRPDVVIADYSHWETVPINK
jgi:hypothetical protein